MKVIKINFKLSLFVLVVVLCCPKVFAANSIVLRCQYALASLGISKTSTYEEVEWFGQAFSKKDWEFFRRVGFPKKNIYRLYSGEEHSLEIIDYSVRKLIDESALEYGFKNGTFAIGQSIMPHTREDAALLKYAMKGIPHEVAKARAFLKNGDVITSKLVHGGFGGVSTKKVYKDLKRKLQKLNVKEEDIGEIEFSHVHPTHEYMNISWNLGSVQYDLNRYHLAPLSFNDLGHDVFFKMFDNVNVTIRAIIPNGYTYHESQSVEGEEVSREEMWKDLGLIAPHYNWPLNQGPLEYIDQSNGSAVQSTRILIAKYAKLQGKKKKSKTDQISIQVLKEELEKRMILIDKISIRKN